MEEPLTLELNEVSKQYGTTAALRQVSATFTPGIYGLLGPNGAGKTTLMNTLAGILEPTSGTILLNGQPIATLGERYRSKLGVVPQQQTIYPFYTGYQFLEYMAALKGIDRITAPEIIRSRLADVGLSQDADKKVGAYSGGMKQRLLLAQALLNDPEILILDEPTAGLDPWQRIHLRNLIAQVSLNKIVFFATHVVTDLECIAKEILLMKQGQFIAFGSVAELVTPLCERVGAFDLRPEKLPELEQEGRIVSMINTGEMLRVHLLYPQGTKVPPEHRRSPTLEDVYLDFFPEGG